MIKGVGTDLVSIKRISKALERSPERFAERVLTPAEQKTFADKAYPVAWFAKRWAAKEAVSKAVGTGIGAELGFHDIEVGHTDQGQPLVHLSARASDAFPGQFHLSLSDEIDHALAFVVWSDD